MVERIEASCKECGLIFVKKANNQRYCCPECQKISARAYQRQYERERYAREKKNTEKKKQQRKRPSIAEINQSARAAGMTYGQYMAKEYGKQVKVERRKEK